MPKTEKKYPDWVQEKRVRGTTVKKKGDAYYLYKRTSRRVPGKKYPQPVDTYIGIITPEGVIKSEKKKVSLGGIEVKEGDDWEEVLSIIVRKWSAETYLLKERKLKTEQDYHYQFPAQAASLSRRIYKEHGVDLKELQILKSIYLLYIDKERVVSKISPEQEELLKRIGVDLSMC